MPRSSTPAPASSIASAFVVSKPGANSDEILAAPTFCALERCRADKGAYPETLDALVPAYAAKLPRDLCNGEPLRYRRTAEGRYLLYSIGRNSKDDGGTLEAPKEGEAQSPWSDDKGDWVWRGVPKR